MIQKNAKRETARRKWNLAVSLFCPTFLLVMFPEKTDLGRISVKTVIWRFQIKRERAQRGMIDDADQGFLPDLTEGVQYIAGTKVIISRGLGDGVDKVIPRINNPPELVIIDANWY